VVVPNGVDVDAVSVPAGDGSDIRQQLGIPQQATVFGYVGSMPQYEGLDDLVEAAARLKAETRDPLYCLLVGDGDQLEALKRTAQQRDVDDRVLFAGRVPYDEVSRYYAAIDIMVFPRKPQPVTEIVSPIKPFEAMAMAKPIIASNVAALAEIILHRETGLLFNKGDTNQLAARMADLARDVELRLRLGRSARVWVRRNRDWSALSQQVTSMYDVLVGDRKKEARADIGISSVRGTSATGA
jgi:glycosyltransferase involved in cell wall biosynthesis